MNIHKTCEISVYAATEELLRQLVPGDITIYFAPFQHQCYTDIENGTQEQYDRIVTMIKKTDLDCNAVFVQAISAHKSQVDLGPLDEHGDSYD